MQHSRGGELKKMAGTNHKRRRVLITGAAGFIGFHLTERLLSEGALVMGLDNINSYYDVRLKNARLGQLTKHSSFSFQRVNLTNHDQVKSLVSTLKPSIVVHLAAQPGIRHSLSQPGDFVASNVDGFLAILEACRTQPVQHLIYASSSSVYGANKKLPFHEDDPVVKPLSLYAATKRAGELMAETYAHLFAIPTSGLRFFTVYGPWGRPDMAYFSFTKAAFEGRAVEVFDSGKIKRDFTFVGDVIEAIIQLLDRPPEVAARTLRREITSPHLIYNVGTCVPVELSEFIARIESATGRPLIQRNLPMPHTEVQVTFADVERLVSVTGFAPRTHLATGLDQFVSWYKTYYAV